MKIKLTESKLRTMITESIASVLNETTDNNTISYNGDGENRETWYEAGITLDDFTLVPDAEIAQIHSSKKGYVIYYEGEEFGEVWLESNGLLRGNSDNDIFGGYLCTFEGYGTDGILEDIMDKTADAISNGDNLGDEEWDDEDWDDWNGDDCIDEE